MATSRVSKQRAPVGLMWGSGQGSERLRRSGRLGLTGGVRKHSLVAAAFAYPAEKSSVIETRFSYLGRGPYSEVACGCEDVALALCRRVCYS